MNQRTYPQQSSSKETGISPSTKLLYNPVSVIKWRITSILSSEILKQLDRFYDTKRAEEYLHPMHIVLILFLLGLLLLPFAHLIAWRIRWSDWSVKKTIVISAQELPWPRTKQKNNHYTTTTRSITNGSETHIKTVQIQYLLNRRCCVLYHPLRKPISFSDKEILPRPKHIGRHCQDMTRKNMHYIHHAIAEEHLSPSETKNSTYFKHIHVLFQHCRVAGRKASGWSSIK